MEKCASFYDTYVSCFGLHRKLNSLVSYQSSIPVYFQRELEGNRYQNIDVWSKVGFQFSKLTFEISRAKTMKNMVFFFFKLPPFFLHLHGKEKGRQFQNQHEFQINETVLIFSYIFLALLGLTKLFQALWKRQNLKHLRFGIRQEMEKCATFYDHDIVLVYIQIQPK